MGCMSYVLVFTVIGVAVLLMACIAALFWWVRRPVSYARSEHAPLPLFSHARAAVWMRDEEAEDATTTELISARAERGERNGTEVPLWSSVPASAPVAASSSSNASSRRSTHLSAAAREENGTPPVQDARLHRDGARPASGHSSPFEPYAPPSHRTVSSVSPVTPPQLDGTSVRFSVPTDATLQFLPGRLEILSGTDEGREVRFVRLPGAEATEVTFGRSAGKPYRHVQLSDATVSRRHARMQMRHGGWTLTNFSVTNPVVHNGVELAEHEEIVLADGDRVEMGEVTFRYRA